MLEGTKHTFFLMLSRKESQIYFSNNWVWQSYALVKNTNS